MGYQTATARRLRSGIGVLLALACITGAGSFFAQASAAQLMLLSASASLAVIAIALLVGQALHNFRTQNRLNIVMQFLEHDSAPGLCTDVDGAIFAQNKSALERFGKSDGETMTKVLEPLFVSPDSVVHRLRLRAIETGSAREEVVTRRGHVRLAVHSIPGGYLWRLEDMVDRAPRTGDGLGLPVLTFGSSGTILYMNETLREMLGTRAKRLRDVFEDVPLRNGHLNRLQTKVGLEDVRVVLSAPVNGRQEVFILPVGETADGRVALDALPVALLRLDADGRVSFANRPARDLLPMAVQDGDRRLAALVEGLGRSVSEWVSDAVAGRGLYRPEIVRVSGVTSETFLQITLGRPLDEGESGLIAVLNDATELKNMELQFVQSQKMQAIGQLAGGVAHDFNNLLTAISGHCDLLLLRHQEGDEDYADLTQITQNANRAAALVGQLLAFSRKQTLEMQQIDLRDTLGDLTHLLNRLVGERVRLRLEHDPALIPIRGDRRQLEQVLMNLVVNARDAMPDGGEIRIETRCRYLDKPMTRDRVTVPAGQFVVVTVSDEGCGIQPDKLQRIFEPFFTTKRPGEGTGLGLSMAYGIMKQSGGYIFADSKAGEGASFSLYFPADPEATAPQAEDAALRLANPTLPNSEKVSQSTQDIANVPFGRPRRPRAPERQSEAPGKPGIQPPSHEENQTDGVPASDLQAKSASAPDPDIEIQFQSLSDELVFQPPVLAKEVVPARRETTLPTRIRLAPVSSLGGHEDGGIKTAQSSVETLKAIDQVDGRPAQPVVLLVEDEAPVRAFASRALRLRGYTVVEAASAEDALDALADDNLQVDLFVTDVMMPGMDGPSWVREALKSRPTVRTVFMSGYAQDALSETSSPVPNATFLAKPFSLSDLTQTVERVLH